MAEPLYSYVPPEYSCGARPLLGSIRKLSFSGAANRCHRLPREIIHTGFKYSRSVARRRVVLVPLFHSRNHRPGA